MPATPSTISQAPRDPNGFYARRAYARGTAHHRHLEGLIDDAPYIRGVLGDGLFQRLDDASLLSDEPVLADLVSRDVSVEGLDAHLHALTGDTLRGVDRSRLLTLGAAREADLRKADAAELAEADSGDAAEATVSDSDDVAAAAVSGSGGQGSAGAA